MKLFPAFLKLEHQNVLVIGGGENAIRKVRLLLKSGAHIHVLAPDPNDEFQTLAEDGTLTLDRRDFSLTDLTDVKLVISATEDDRIDQAVSAAAKARDIPVNVPDRVELSTFVMPALVDRTPLLIAIGSGGSAPVLVRNIREKLEGMLPARLGDVARFADSFRDKVKASRPDGTQRRRFWESFFASPIVDHVLNGDDAKARAATLAAIGSPPDGLHHDTGHVTIVGAGPGDPDLLTFRAANAMQRADVVLYDNLVSKEIMEHVRRDADRVFVGKSTGRHSKSQDEINDLMITYAQAGNHVVRLKGGDPYLFGRGGEELEVLKQHGISVNVVPGITAAFGCAASAGIPLTHRDHAQAVTFVTGHLKEGGLDLDWDRLAQTNQTLVIYMGVGTSEKIATRLIGAGLKRSTPVAIIENGTRRNERILKTTLAELAVVIEAEAIKPPALIIIGDVVSVADVDQLSDLAHHAIAS